MFREAPGPSRSRRDLRVLLLCSDPGPRYLFRPEEVPYSIWPFARLGGNNHWVEVGCGRSG